MAKDRLLKNTLIYFIGTMATRLVNFLFIPLYTSMISPAILGDYDVVYSALSVVIPALFFMLWDVFLRFFLDSADQQGRDRVSTTVVLTSVCMLAVYLAVFAVANRFLHLRNGFLIALTGAGWMLASVWQSGMRAHARNRDYALSGVIATFVSAAVNLFMIFVLKKQEITLYLAQAASFFTVFLIAEFRLKLLSKIRLKNFDPALLKRMLVYGLPLIVNSIAFWLINYVNRPIVLIQIGPEANGYLAAASKFSMLIATIAQIFFFAWQEESFREAKNEKLPGYMSNVMDTYSRVLFGGVCFGLPLLKIVLPYIIVSRNFNYDQSYPLIPAVIMMAVYSALSTFVSTSYYAKMMTKQIMLTTAAGGLVSVLLSWFGAKIFGLQAVAISSALGFLLVFLLRVAFSGKYVKVAVHWPKFIGLNLAAGAAIAAFFLESRLLLALASLVGLAFFLFLNRTLLGMLLRKVRALRKARTAQ